MNRRWSRRFQYKNKTRITGVFGCALFIDTMADISEEPTEEAPVRVRQKPKPQADAAEKKDGPEGLAALLKVHEYSEYGVKHTIITLVNPRTKQMLVAFTDKTNDNIIKGQFRDEMQAHQRRQNIEPSGALMTYLRQAVSTERDQSDPTRNTAGGIFNLPKAQEDIGEFFRMMDTQTAFDFFANIGVDGAPAVFASDKNNVKITCLVSRTSNPIYTYASVQIVLSRRV